MNDIKSRSVTFIISVLTISILIFLSKNALFSLLFLASLCIVSCVALWEYYKIVEHKGSKPFYALGLAGSAIYILSVYLSIFFPAWIGVPKIILGVLLFLFFVQNLFYIRAPLISISTSSLGFLYVVIPLSFVLNINFFFPLDAPISGQWWLMYLLVVTKSVDLGAYFVGKFWGKKPLAPKISPKKTVEGLIGGIFCSLLASFLLIYLTPHVRLNLHIPWLFSLLMALVLAIFGQIGDLAESLIKRDAGVKDSNKIKGSGGILDMVDSMLFNLPLFYIFLIYGNVL